MRFAWCVPVLAVCLAGFASGQSPRPTASQLEAFRRFAETSTAQVIWSQEAGRIDSDRARAVVTALTVEVTGKRNRRMRGIRIDLTEGDRGGRIYTREEHLNRAINGLGEVAKFPSESPSEDCDTPDRCHGSELFWMQQAHGFAASECTLGSLDDWVGLVVHDHQQGNFHFTDKEAADFAKVLVAAGDELKRNSPRR